MLTMRIAATKQSLTRPETMLFEEMVKGLEQAGGREYLLVVASRPDGSTFAAVLNEKMEASDV